MLQLERQKEPNVDILEQRKREESADGFCIVDASTYVPRIVIPNIIHSPSLPPTVRQSRAVSTTTNTTLLLPTTISSSKIEVVGIALTKEAFPLHCQFCNRTVVTEPEGVPTWRTWGWCAMLTPVLMCVLPWYQGWGCEYRHKCGRCSRVLAIYKQQPDK